MDLVRLHETRFDVLWTLLAATGTGQLSSTGMGFVGSVASKPCRVMAHRSRAVAWALAVHEAGADARRSR